MERFKKQISLLMTVLLLFIYVAYPVMSYAQEEPSVTPTPEVQADTTVNNETVATTEADTTSNTGDNSINETPTPTPTETQSEVTEENTPQNNEEITPENTEEATSTESAQESNPNSIVDSSTSTTTGPSIDSGDAISVTSLQNDINTTYVNAKVVNQTINLFVDQDGNINLSDPFAIASAAVQSHPQDSVINVSVTNVNNFAYLENNVVSFANSGNNSINGGDAVINTGDAYSIVSLLNNVNFTVVNSDIHVITINIFGNLNGNIVLPNLVTSSQCSSCGMSTTVTNEGYVQNDINSDANSGENSITGNNASIQTGDASSVVNNLNLVNTTVTGSTAHILYINNLGNWDGNFVGWDGVDPTQGGADLVFYSLSSDPNSEAGCNCNTIPNINNTAFVLNNVSSNANSGGNTINGNNGSIKTGNAYSSVSLINLINSSFINSVGFFGFINIFGNWTGNIGGQKELAALDPPSQDNNNQGNENTNFSADSIDEGGLLEVSQTNNTGAFVYPGDTITFFLKTKNPGHGRVHNTKLYLDLIYKNQSVGGVEYNLGDIDPGKGIKVTTGLVLSKNAGPGVYIARAYVTGTEGPNNNVVEATSDSQFTIFGNFANIGNIKNIVPPVAKSSVLGTSVTPSQKESVARVAREMLYISLLMLVIFTYTSIRLIRKKEFVMAIWTSNTFKERVYSLRMFLL